MLSDIPSPNIDLTTATGILAGSHGGTGWGSILSGFIPFGNGTGPLATSTNLYWDSTNSRLGVATTSPSNTFEVNGTAAALHVRGVGSTPGIATGSGLGTGGSASIKGSDIAGEITAISGLLPMGGSTLVTVTFSSAYPTAPYVVLTPANAATALLSGLTAVYVTDTTTTFVITSGATGLGGSATYKWNYLVVE